MESLEINTAVVRLREERCPKDAETTVCILDADVGFPEQLNHAEESKQKALFASGDRDADLVCAQLCPPEPSPVWDELGGVAGGKHYFPGS